MIEAACSSYSPFWQSVHDFQPLIASALGLTSVAGALTGIKLQNYLAARTLERDARKERVSTAIMIRSLLLSEANFPELSLLATPTPKQVYQTLFTTSAFDLKTSDYLSYLGKMATSLTGFPRPISERASFVTWVSARVLLATSQARTIEQNDPIPLKQASEEIRLMLIAAMEAAKQLAYELGMYANSPLWYEKRWSREIKVKHSLVHFDWESFKSDAFNLEDLRGSALAIHSGSFQKAEREGQLP
jgi:hypothetical protein